MSQVYTTWKKTFILYLKSKEVVYSSLEISQTFFVWVTAIYLSFFFLNCYCVFCGGGGNYSTENSLSLHLSMQLQKKNLSNVWKVKNMLTGNLFFS